jgi:hypothetical protein
MCRFAHVAKSVSGRPSALANSGRAGWLTSFLHSWEAPIEVTLADLLALIAGIAMATEHYPDPAAQAHRLFRLAAAGLGPQH